MSEKNTKTPNELTDSLTGFDEMSITQHFGRPVTDLYNADSSMWLRALVFTLKRREGLIDDDARNAAMAMTLAEVAECFPDESVESGKDKSSTELSPETSPPSAS